MQEQPDPRCPHCRIAFAAQEWFADPVNGAKADLALFRAENPDHVDTDQSLMAQRLAHGFGEAFADAINSAVLQHLDVALLMNHFINSFNTRSTAVNMPLSYETPRPQGGGMN